MLYLLCVECELTLQELSDIRGKMHSLILINPCFIQEIQKQTL